MTFYTNRKISLEEKALTQVAINLCQSNSFKEIALNLEKPTYGSFLYEVPPPAPTLFVSDPETLSIWDKVKDDERLCEAFRRSGLLGKGRQLSRWHAAVDEQCLGLTEGLLLPNSLKQGLRLWIKRIALEYLTYSRRQEVLFGVPRYILMDFLTVKDWTSDGRIDEKKVALRLLNLRLTDLRKYVIACVYCSEVHIKHLWNILPQNAKQLLVGGFIQNPFTYDFGGSFGLFSLWSRFMNGEIGELELRIRETGQVTRFGNRSELVACWKRLPGLARQRMVIGAALFSLDQWEKVENSRRVEEDLVSPLVPSDPRCIETCTLPSYYGEMTVFYLSQMNQEQRLAFFKKIFFEARHSPKWKSITKLLLTWPHQDCFLPTIKQLWGIMPKEEYNQCLMVLTQKYSGVDGRSDCGYDYRSLLGALWEETPEEYKNFVLGRETEHLYLMNETGTLLSQLLRRSSFKKEDQMLFEQIFRDQPQEKRREMMLGGSAEGSFICSRLIRHEKWTFLNWFLRECMTEEEVGSFKKRIIPSFYGARLCMDLFEEDRVRLVEEVFDWCLASDAEKEMSKYNFIRRANCLHACASLLRKGKFAAVERVINFFSFTVEEKEQFKVRFSFEVCRCLLEDYAHDSWLEDCVWEQLDGITAWTLDSEELLRTFKSYLMSHAGIETHHKLVFIRSRQKKVDRFYRWFNLTPEEITQLKEKAFLPPEAQRHGATDEELKAIARIKISKYFWEKELIKEFLEERGKSKEKVQDERNGEGVFMKDEGRKRPLAVEDESDSPIKRHKYFLRAKKSLEK